MQLLSLTTHRSTYDLWKFRCIHTVTSKAGADCFLCLFNTHEPPKRVPISVLFWFPIISPLKQPWIFTDANSPSGCRPRPVRLFSIPNCPTWQLGERMETSSCGTWKSAGSASWCFSVVYLICSALLDMRTSRFAPSCGFATTTIRKTAFSTTDCSVRVSRAKSLK